MSRDHMTDQPKGGIAGKVVLGCGGLLLLVSLGVTLFCAFHVFIDPRGAISRSEAMPGFLAGGFFGEPIFVGASRKHADG